MTNSTVYRFALIALCCLTLFSAHVSAMVPDTISDVPTPCNTCPSAKRDWSTIAVTTKVINLEGCMFTIYYKERTCPANGCIEIKVEKVVSDPNPCPKVSNDNLMTMVLGHMIVSNAIGLDTNSIGSSACITIIKPACWRITTTLSSPCGFTQVNNDELINPYRVQYKIGQLQPCDTSECCTNTQYVTVTNCDGLKISGSPSASEYVHFYRLHGRTSPDSVKQHEIDSAIAEFDRQYSDKTCRECPPAPPQAMMPEMTNPPPTTLPPCKRSCDEDLVLEYFKLMRGDLLKKYGGQP